MICLFQNEKATIIRPAQSTEGKMLGSFVTHCYSAWSCQVLMLLMKDSLLLPFDGSRLAGRERQVVATVFCPPPSCARSERMADVGGHSTFQTLMHRSVFYSAYMEANEHHKRMYCFGARNLAYWFLSALSFVRCCSALLALGVPQQRRKTRQGALDNDFMIHRIRSPRLRILDDIDDGKIDINNPDLYIDHVLGEHDNSVYYLATMRGNSTVIGMVEVSPDVHYDNDDDDVPTIPGLLLDDVRVAELQQRRGVATAMLKRVERDIVELVELMDLARRHGEVKGAERVNMTTIELRLWSVKTRQALSFY